MKNGLCCALPLLALVPAAHVLAATDEVAELRSMVRDLQRQLEVVPDLERQIAELRNNQDPNWLTEQRAGEIRSLVQDVLADADTRASLLGSGMSAGWDNGFFIGSTDGNFRLRIGGQMQQRFVYNYQDNSPVDNHRSGFEVRRARLLLSGHIIDPSWTYDIQLAVNRTNGNMQLEDAGWIQKDLGNGWKVRVGQMKAPFMREEMLSSIRMLLVERSLLNSMFSAGLVQGVQIGWEGDNLRAYAMYHDGNNSGNTAWSVEDTEIAVSARLEWLAYGEWRNFLDYSGFRDETPGLLFGVAINYSQQEYGTTFMPGPPPTGNNFEVQNFGVTIDATLDFSGASLAGAFVYRNLSTSTGSPADIDLDQYGFFIRGGVFITDEWELFGQYEWGHLDMPGVTDLSIVTVGATRYWAKHRLKWQTDVGYGINRVMPVWASDGAGWRGDSAGNNGQIVVRSQLQLVF
ncbi:MAG TPA: porin [Phycisphaerales bacterium]|nr:porin [Phycisphaerales bacterium]HRQ75196.1 porin [Phycisphaerales bacterium]